MLLTPALRRQRQVDLYDFQAMVFRVRPLEGVYSEASLLANKLQVAGLAVDVQLHTDKNIRCFPLRLSEGCQEVRLSC